MTVRVMSVQPCVRSRHVPPFSRGFVGVCSHGNGYRLPSEGKGHTFESCRVRQFSAILADTPDRPVPSYVSVTRLCSRGVPDSFPSPLKREE